MGNKIKDNLFHGTNGNPQLDFEQKEFAINNNGEDNSKEEREELKDETHALINGSNYNTAQSTLVKKMLIK